MTALLCRPVLVTQKLLAAFPLGVPSVGVMNYACLSLDTRTCPSARAKSKRSFPQPGKTMGWGNGSSLPSPQQAPLKMLAPRPVLCSIESGALESHCLRFASMIGLHIPHGGTAGEAPLCVAEHTLVPKDTSETTCNVASMHMEPTLMILQRPDKYTRDLEEIN